VENKAKPVMILLTGVCNGIRMTQMRLICTDGSVSIRINPCHQCSI